MHIALIVTDQYIIAPYVCCTLGVGIGTLDELASSHTRLAIYPTLTKGL